MADEREQAWEDYGRVEGIGMPEECFSAGYDAGYHAGIVERDAYKATADDLSQRDADWRAEVDRLRALLGEALTALRHVETGPDMWLDCCRNAIAPVLAKLAQEGLS